MKNGTKCDRCGKLADSLSPYEDLAICSACDAHLTAKGYTCVVCGGRFFDTDCTMAGGLDNAGMACLACDAGRLGSPILVGVDYLARTRGGLEVVTVLGFDHGREKWAVCRRDDDSITRLSEKAIGQKLDESDIY